MSGNGSAGGRFVPAAVRLLLLVLLMVLSACGAAEENAEQRGAAAAPETENAAVQEQTGTETDKEETLPGEDAASSTDAAAPAQGEMQEPGQPMGQGQPAAAAPQNGQAGDSGTVQQTLRLSYANYAYVDSGDPSVPKLLRNVEATAEAADASPETLVRCVLEALKIVPAGTQGAETMVCDLYRINSITVENGAVTIDISGDGIADASMYDEAFFVYQTADSILHSVSGTQYVRFTINGTQDSGFRYLDIHQNFDEAACSAFCGG